MNSYLILGCLVIAYRIVLLASYREPEEKKVICFCVEVCLSSIVFEMVQFGLWKFVSNLAKSNKWLLRKLKFTNKKRFSNLLRTSFYVNIASMSCFSAFFCANSWSPQNSVNIELCYKKHTCAVVLEFFTFIRLVWVPHNLTCQ